MPETSIILTAEDRVSAKLKSLSQNTKHFNKDLDDLAKYVNTTGKRIDALTADLTQQKTAMVDTKKVVADARKEFNKYGTEVSKVKLEKATQKQEKLTQSIHATKKAIRDSEKQLYRYADTATKKTAQAGKGFSGLMSQIRNGEGMMGGLFAAGAGLMVGNALQQAGNVAAGSMLGSHGGTMFGSVLGGATTGAAMGMAIGPQAAGIGAAIGAGAGLVQGVAQVGQKRDEAFKSYVTDLYERNMEKQLARTETGSEIAGGREVDTLGFTTLLGGQSQASAFMSDVVDFAAHTPFHYDDLTGMSRTLLAYGTAAKDILPTLTAVGDAGAALGMDFQNMNMAATALGRMTSTNKANLEYMNLLTERGVGAIDWLAERDNISVSDVYDRISKGEYSGKEVSAFITQQMELRYGGSMEAMSKTFDGLASTLSDYEANFAAAQGKGYNDTRKIGMQQQLSDYEELNPMIKTANAIIGQAQAIEENEKIQMQTDSIRALLTGHISDNIKGTGSEDRLKEMAKTYQRDFVLMSEGTKEQGIAAAKEMGNLMAEARGIAENEFNASDGQQMRKQSELDTIDKLAQDTAINDAYWDAGYKYGEEMSKGLLNALFYFTKQDMTDGADKTADYIDSILAPGYATGLAWVPYDDFPARLHEGERVLTASQARNYNSGRSAGNSPSIVIHMPGAVMRSDNDVKQVAATLLEELKMAEMAGVYRD